MAPLKKIARRHNLLLIEDACQAHGAEYRGKKTGALGDCAAFSLNGSKNLPGGEGGLLTTNQKWIVEKGGLLQMRVRLRGGRRYPAYTLGYNARMHEMVAAFVRSQLRRLDALNAGRRRNAEFLSRHLSRIPGLTPPITPPDRTHVYHMYPLRLDPKALGVDLPARQFRQCVEKALQAEGAKVHQWVDRILPDHAVYQVQEGYGRGCPWSCPFASRRVTYPPDRFREEYPEAMRMLDETTLVWGFAPPNDLKLMRLYVEAFEKVFDHLDEALE
jgi:dTDP-4-amino-4,6-dideoxygalactose transaminase